MNGQRHRQKNGAASSNTSEFTFEKLPDANTQTVLGYYILDGDDNVIGWNLFYAPITLGTAGGAFSVEIFATLQPNTCSVEIEARISSIGGIELGGSSHWAIIGENGIQSVIAGVFLGGESTTRLINYHAGTIPISLGASASTRLINYFAGSGGVSFGGGSATRLINYYAGSGGVSFGGEANYRLINYAPAGPAGIALGGEIYGGTYVLDPVYYFPVGGFILGSGTGHRKVFPGNGGFILGASADYWTGFSHESTGGFELGGEHEKEVIDPPTCVFSNDFSTDEGLFVTNGDAVTTITGGVAEMVIDGSNSSADNGGLQYQEGDIPTNPGFSGRLKVVSHTGNFDHYVMVNFRQDSPSSASLVAYLQWSEALTLNLWVNGVFQGEFPDTTEWMTWTQEYNATTGEFYVAVEVDGGGGANGTETVSTGHDTQVIIFKPYSVNAADDITVQWDDVCIYDAT